MYIEDLISVESALNFKRLYDERIKGINEEIQFMASILKVDIEAVNNEKELCFKNERFMDKVHEYGKSLVIIKNGLGSFSGFLICDSRNFVYVMTAKHCIIGDNAPFIEVLEFLDCNIRQRNRIPCLVIASGSMDIAILKVSKDDLDYPKNYKFPIVIFRRDPVSFYTPLIKYGGTIRNRGAFSFGNSIDYNLYGYGEMRSTCIVYSGDSGGFITDFCGHVLGMSILSDTHSGEIAYSISSNVLMDEVDVFKKYCSDEFCDLNLSILEENVNKKIEISNISYSRLDEDLYETLNYRF